MASAFSILHLQSPVLEPTEEPTRADQQHRYFNMATHGYRMPMATKDQFHCL